MESIMDKIFWEYLEMLPEQEITYCEWRRHLSDWHCFNTFYNYFLKVDEKHAKFLGCTTPCEFGCPRQIEENTPYDITAVCTQNKADPIPLKFRDILMYSMRHEDFHKAICASLQIEQPLNKLSECRSTWYLGEHSGTAVYLTCRMTELTETIGRFVNYCVRRRSSLWLRPCGMTSEAQQLLAGNDAVLLSMADEFTLQSDGSFKLLRNA